MKTLRIEDLMVIERDRQSRGTITRLNAASLLLQASFKQTYGFGFQIVFNPQATRNFNNYIAVRLQLLHHVHINDGICSHGRQAGRQAAAGCDC